MKKILFCSFILSLICLSAFCQVKDNSLNLRKNYSFIGKLYNIHRADKHFPEIAEVKTELNLINKQNISDNKNVLSADNKDNYILKLSLGPIGSMPGKIIIDTPVFIDKTGKISIKKDMKIAVLKLKYASISIDIYLDSFEGKLTDNSLEFKLVTYSKALFFFKAFVYSMNYKSYKICK